MADEKTKKVEGVNYWSVTTLIAPVDSADSMTMDTFIRYVEARCPKKDGWVVVQRETNVMEQAVAGGNRMYLPYLTYHLEKQ